MNSLNKIFRKRTLNQLYNLIVISIAIVIGFIIRNNKKYDNIWIISERPNEARDNGFHLFKYIRINYPSMKVYYVIDKKARDRTKIEKFGNLINYGSFKHFIYYVLCKKHISTHINGTAPDDKICPTMNRLMFKDKKNIFLQHGVIKDYLPQLCANKTNLNLFVCGAKLEYDFIKANFGYVHEEVQYLGLTRFDNLHNFSLKKQVLLMPTFRMWLWNPTKEKTKEECKKFSKSIYYKTYQAFINNKNIADLLSDNNLELIFYPHYEAQNYLHLFSTKFDNIIIASKSNYDVQQLLKESMLLITDYSSVYFDFAYMRKPVLYYHFDYEEYRSKHYGMGYFSYEDDGFGPIAQTEEQIYEELSSLINSDFIINPVYKKRIDKFFPLYDRENTKRNFEAIYKL